MHRTVALSALTAASALATVVVAATVPAGAGPAASGAHGSGERWCAEKFDRAQRQDMESFRDYDAERFRDVHHPDAISVFSVGEVAVGLDAVMEALAPYFEARAATWSWTEVTRSVHGCRSAVIVYRTLLERPGLTRHALNTVTYTYERGRWLVVSDQGTEVPPPAADTP